MWNQEMTFTEWADLYGIALLAADPIDLMTEDGQPRLMTYTEFEQRVMNLMARRRPLQQIQQARQTQPLRNAPKSKRRVRLSQPGRALPKVSYRRVIPMLMWVTIPAAAYLVITLLLRVIKRFFNIHWLVSLCILLVDAAILVIQPVAALFAGSGFCLVSPVECALRVLGAYLGNWTTALTSSVAQPSQRPPIVFRHHCRGIAAVTLFWVITGDCQ